jgi:hypothetical protein
MLVPQALIGTVVLFLGRRLFWLFVGLTGFLLGVEIATFSSPDSSSPTVLALAIAAGLTGAVLAYFFQATMIAVVGFVVGARLAVVVFNFIDPIGSRDMWALSFLVGGVIGAALLVALFDSVLVLLSSVLGASLIVQTVDARPYVKLGVFLALVVVGMGVQSNLPAPRPRAARPHPPAGTRPPVLPSKAAGR